MSITADCSYQIENPDDPEAPLTVTISGTQTYPDTGPPYTRRGMRCGTGYTGPFAKRLDWKSYGRFYLGTEIPSNEQFPLTVGISGEPGSTAAIYDGGFTSYPKFISGLFKPENTDDPAYVCADGIWRKSTEITKGLVQIFDDIGQWLANGYFARIESGAEITYYRPNDLENSIGTGTITYTLANA